MTALCGLAPSFSVLFAARVGVGVGEASLLPAAYALLAERFPGPRLPRAMGVFVAGATIGAGLSLAAVGLLMQRALDSAGLPLPAWRLVFIAIAAPGAAALPVVLRLRAGRPPAAAGAAPRPSVRAALLGARRGAYLLHFAGFALFNAAVFALVAWSPTARRRGFGLDYERIGLLTGLIQLSCAPAGALIGTRLAGRTARPDAPLTIAAVGALGLAAFMALLGAATSLAAALACLACGVVLGCMPLALAPASLQMITPADVRSSVSGVYLLVVNLVGYGVGPLLIGRVSDTLFDGGRSVQSALAVVLPCLCLGAALCLLRAKPLFRRAAR